MTQAFILSNIVRICQPACTARPIADELGFIGRPVAAEDGFHTINLR